MRSDFYVIGHDLDFIKGPLTRLPTRREFGADRTGNYIFAAAALVIPWIELVPR